MSVFVEVLPVDRFERREVIRLVGRTRKKPLPGRTFRRWCSFLRITTDEDGLFHGDDVDLLRSLAKWFNRGGKTYKGFARWYEQRQELKPETQSTVDVQVIKGQEENA